MADIRASLILDTKQAEKGIKNVGNALKAVLGAAAVKEVLAVGNAFQEVRNKLMSVSEGGEEATAKFKDVVDIARTTRSGLEETADLYFRMTKASENLGLSQQETARVTELFAKTLKNSGATSQEAASAILQFGQAMASGKLAGDEFRSINETNTDLMDRLAKALEVNRGELKKMASEGKLTADVIAAALLESGDDIDSTFQKTTTTLNESFTAIRREFTVLVGKIEESTGIFSGLANLATTLANNLDKVAIALAIAFGVKTAQMIMGVVKAMNALKVATKAQTVAQAILLSLSGPAGWAILAGGVVAAGTAMFALNKLTEDQVEEQEDIGKEQDKNKKTAKQLLEESKKKTEEEKKQKQLTTEQTRLLADQIEDFKSMGDALKLNSQEFQDQLDLQVQLANATENQKDIIQDIADIETDRKDALQDLADLTLISTDDRLAREQDINDEFDRRIELTKTTNTLLFDASQIQRRMDGFNSLSRAAKDYQKELQTLRLVQSASTSQEKRDLSNLMDFYRGQEQARADLRKEFAGVEDFDQFQRIFQTLTDDEKDQYNKRASDLEVFLTASLIKYQAFADARNEIENEFNSKFSNGFKAAFDEFKENVENSAAFGARVFNTMTTGFEDAFLKFAETGKLSFKDLFKTLMQEIIKMMANKLFLSLFGGGGVFGSLFAGLFHNGGNIPSGKFGIAGERGPEIITGPASVMSTNDTASLMGSRGTTVNYNINAVDAPSFQSLVARDPEFIFSVTEAGRRRLPGSRV